MRIWAFVQQKGGCGKSTLATNLAVMAERQGETVLIVDLDPQSNALLWSKARGGVTPMVMDALPENLTAVLGAAAELGVTLVLIDTPSKIDATALLAIRAADMIVCPTTPDLFSLGALGDTVRLLKDAGKLSAAVAVVNNVDDGSAASLIGEAEAVLASFGMPASPVAIRHRASFPSAIKRGKSVLEAMPKGKPAAEIRELWTYLHGRARQLATAAGKKRRKSKEKSR